MNTGVQRSSATPVGAHTSTAPSGSHSTGKQEIRKDLTKTLVAHNIPYIAQTTPYHWKGRFKHLFKPGNEHVLESTQAFVDKEWEKLLKLEESTAL